MFSRTTQKKEGVRKGMKENKQQESEILSKSF